MSDTVWVTGFDLRMDSVMLLVPDTHPEKGNGYHMLPLSRDLFDDEDVFQGQLFQALLRAARHRQQSEQPQ